MHVLFRKFMNFSKILNKVISKFSNKLVFSGGCALNSSANKILTENKSLFENVYINYAPGDNGGAIGAALVVANQNGKKIENLKTPYLGRKFNKDEIEGIVNKYEYKKKLNYKFFDKDEDFFNHVSKLISENNVIGWFRTNGICPWVLEIDLFIDPRNPNMKDIITVN